MASRHMRTPAACMCGSKETMRACSGSTEKASNFWSALVRPDVQVHAVAKQAPLPDGAARLPAPGMELEPDVQTGLRMSAVRMQVRAAEHQPGVGLHQPAHARVEDILVAPHLVRLAHRVGRPIRQAVDALGQRVEGQVMNDEAPADGREVLVALHRERGLLHLDRRDVAVLRQPGRGLARDGAPPVGAGGRHLDHRAGQHEVRRPDGPAVVELDRGRHVGRIPARRAPRRPRPRSGRPPPGSATGRSCNPGCRRSCRTYHGGMTPGRGPRPVLALMERAHGRTSS